MHSVTSLSTLNVSQSAPTTRRSDAVGSPGASKSAARSRYWRRNRRLEELGYENYRTYLRSPHWLKLRKRYRESDLPQTCICGEEEVQLHHVTYERVGDEYLSDLTPLCASCHSLVHVLEWRGDLGIDLKGLTDSERAEAGRQFLAERFEAIRQQRAADKRARQQALLGLSFATRLMQARTVAKRRRIDLSHQLHILRKGASSGASDLQMTKRLRVIEALAYGWEDWDPRIDRTKRLADRMRPAA